MASTTLLGEYLVARRALLRPHDVGLPTRGRRRVPGLRREEVAALAGISADYYLRLEQGRDDRPSARVIDALARALRLDAAATAHLQAIARPVAGRNTVGEPERAPATVANLIDRWTDTPAVIFGRFLDVLAANDLAMAFGPLYRPGINIVRAVFLDPAVRRMTEDWERVTTQAVGRLRSLAGPDLDHPRMRELVEKLCAQSERFAQLWSRHDAVLATIPVHTIVHDTVGPMYLHANWFQIAGTDGQTLLTYHAELGSPSDVALRRLRDQVTATRA